MSARRIRCTYLLSLCLVLNALACKCEARNFCFVTQETYWLLVRPFAHDLTSAGMTEAAITAAVAAPRPSSLTVDAPPELLASTLCLHCIAARLSRWHTAAADKADEEACPALHHHKLGCHQAGGSHACLPALPACTCYQMASIRSDSFNINM